MSRSYKFRARILAHEPIAGFPNSGVPVRSIELANIRELSSGRPVKNQVNRAGKIFKSAKPGDTVMFEATVGFPDIRDTGYRLEKRLLRPQNVRVLPNLNPEQKDEKHMMTRTEATTAARYRLEKRLGRPIRPGENLTAQRDSSGIWQITATLHFVLRDH